MLRVFHYIADPWNQMPCLFPSTQDPASRTSHQRPPQKPSPVPGAVPAQDVFNNSIFLLARGGCRDVTFAIESDDDEKHFQRHFSGSRDAPDRG